MVADLIRLITKATIGVLEEQNTMFCFYGNVVFYTQKLLIQTMMPSATLQPNTLLAIPKQHKMSMGQKLVVCLLVSI